MSLYKGKGKKNEYNRRGVWGCTGHEQEASEERKRVKATAQNKILERRDGLGSVKGGGRK